MLNGCRGAWVRVTTLSQEAVNPERDLPRATILCLFITTLLYCAVSGVLTGMVRFPMEPEVWEGEVVRHARSQNAFVVKLANGAVSPLTRTRPSATVCEHGWMTV